MGTITEEDGALRAVQLTTDLKPGLPSKTIFLSLSVSTEYLSLYSNELAAPQSMSRNFCFHEPMISIEGGSCSKDGESLSKNTYKVYLLFSVVYIFMVND